MIFFAAMTKKKSTAIDENMTTASLLEYSRSKALQLAGVPDGASRAPGVPVRAAGGDAVGSDGTVGSQANRGGVWDAHADGRGANARPSGDGCGAGQAGPRTGAAFSDGARQRRGDNSGEHRHERGGGSDGPGRGSARAIFGRDRGYAQRAIGSTLSLWLKTAGQYSLVQC